MDYILLLVFSFLSPHLVLSVPVCKNDAGESVACAELPLDKHGLPQATPYYIPQAKVGNAKCFNDAREEVPCSNIEFDEVGRPIFDLTRVHYPRNTCVNDDGEIVDCRIPDDGIYDEAPECPNPSEETEESDEMEEMEMNNGTVLESERKKRSVYDSFAKEGLGMHNRLPERKGNPYKLDRDLCKGAQSYANELARSDSRTLQHSSQNTRVGIGENLAWKSPTTVTVSWSDGRTETKSKAGDKPSAAVVVKSWYNEKYPHVDQYSRNGFNHFTQVVWAGSKKLCMATAMSSSGAWFTVGRYYPQGNMVFNGRSQRTANVPVVSGQVCCGGHKANTCASCGTSPGRCNGACTWKKGVGKPDVCY